MREWKITCDHCGIEIIGNPFTAVIERVGREQDASVMDGETVTLDLCEKCVDELQSWKMIHTSGDISRTIRHTSKEIGYRFSQLWMHSRWQRTMVQTS